VNSKYISYGNTGEEFTQEEILHADGVPELDKSVPG